ncbi:MAG: MBOAT family O-acyltransferase, partial [Alphaproteobacteria bacterium]
MAFSSIEYVVFFLVYLALARLVAQRRAIALIVVASLVFYAWWDPWLVWVPACLCTIGYAGALWVDAADAPRHRRLRILATVAALLVPLALFKYQHFLYGEIVAPLCGLAPADLRHALPLGISFITFTMIAYAVDVHRRRFPVERSYGHILAYTLYFPQLIAGPILRPHELLPQLLRRYRLRLASLGLGFTVFTVGLVKKTVFADPLGGFVDPVFATPDGWTTPVYWLAQIAFTVQIYCDFSGYTDMAIGSAIMLGVRLPRNFERPFAATNLQDFWRRWHMTLSRWLRDYLYIPLGGGHQPLAGQAAAIMITMTLGGLWHGANWTFIVWGAMHGIVIALLHAARQSPGASAACRTVPLVLKWLATVGFFALSLS